MANLLTIENLKKGVGDRILFENITFGVDEGEKIGIIARNGTGKSTLLSIIAGEQSADSGNIVTRNGLRIVYLPQEPEFAPGATVIEAAMQFADPSQDMVKVRSTLTKLDLADPDVPVSVLSGGQRKRLALARVVMMEPDLLLLDEPTNHLDIEIIEWLENYLKRSRATLLMVTHDRYFLDRVCNRIIEMDRGSIFSVDGNYDMYLCRRAERIEALEARQDKARNLLRKEQDWMSRQPQARATKAKYRIENFHALTKEASLLQRENNVSLDARSSRVGSKIFEAEGISKSFGDKVILRDFTYTFAPGEKIGIVGHNGVGKSTFIKMLQGIEPTDSGEWNVGQTVRFGYYSQDGMVFDTSKKVIDAVQEIAEDIDLGDRRIAPMQYLQRFLFSAADQQKYIYKLSGGERCRLHLAVVLMQQPNFLILDEPTNDLDIVTLGILEEYLAEFKGCVIVVSHDRFFLDSIVDHLFVMEGEGIVRDFPGNYSEYREQSREQNREKAKDNASKTKAASDNRAARAESRPAKLTYKERKEMESLESEIESLTAEKAAIERFFVEGGEGDYNEKSRRLNEINELLDAKEMRWLELSEKQ